MRRWIAATVVALGLTAASRPPLLEASRWFENALSMVHSRTIAYLNLGDA